MSNSKIREMLNGMADEIIRDGVNRDSALENILGSMDMSAKRTLIIGGAMRIARREEFQERMEWRERRMANRHN
jgi:hypothetical protein